LPLPIAPVPLEVDEPYDDVEGSCGLRVRQRLEVRKPAKQDRRVLREAPTRDANPHHSAGPELVVELSLVPRCAGVQLPYLAGELGVGGERAGGGLEILAAHRPLLLLPHQAPEPRVASRVER
jgi:hypothetical protein